MSDAERLEQAKADLVAAAAGLTPESRTSVNETLVRMFDEIAAESFRLNLRRNIDEAYGL